MCFLGIRDVEKWVDLRATEEMMMGNREGCEECLLSFHLVQFDGCGIPFTQRKQKPWRKTK